MTITLQVSTRQYHAELAELVRGMVPIWVSTPPAGHPPDQPFKHRMVLTANPEVSVLEMDPATGRTEFVQTNYLDLLEVHFLVAKSTGAADPGAITLAMHNVETTMQLRLYDRLRDFLARKTGIVGEHWLFNLEEAGSAEDQDFLLALQAFSKACIQVEQAMTKCLLDANGDQQNLLLIANLQGGLREFAANNYEFSSSGRPREFAISISQMNVMLGQLDHLREVQTKMPGVVSLLPFIIDERMADGSFNAMALVRAYLERSLGGISPKDLVWLEQLPSVQGTYVLSLLSNMTGWDSVLNEEHAPLLLSLLRHLHGMGIPVLPAADAEVIYQPLSQDPKAALPSMVFQHLAWILRVPRLVAAKIDGTNFRGLQPQDLDTLTAFQTAAQECLFLALTRWLTRSKQPDADAEQVLALLKEELSMWSEERDNILDYVADLVKDHVQLLKQQLTASWGWWRSSSDTWHEMVALRNLQTVDKSTWFTAMPKNIVLRGHAQVLGEVRPVQVLITPLTTAYDLALEGKRMKHCVGGYAHHCVSGRSRIFNITQLYLDSDTGAWVKVASGTLELTWSENSGSTDSARFFELPTSVKKVYNRNQFLGLQNQAVKQQASQIVADFLRYYTTMTEAFLAAFGDGTNDALSKRILSQALANGVTEGDQRLGFVAKQLREGKLFVVPNQHILNTRQGATRNWGIELASHTQLKDNAWVLDIDIHLPKTYLEQGLPLLRDSFQELLPASAVTKLSKAHKDLFSVSLRAKDLAYEVVNKFQGDFRDALTRDLYALVSGLKTQGTGDRNWLHGLLLQGRGSKIEPPIEETPPSVGPSEDEQVETPPAPPPIATEAVEVAVG